MPISRQARITRRAISPRLATRMRWNIVPFATALASTVTPYFRCSYLAGGPRKAVLRKQSFPSGSLGTARKAWKLSTALTRTDAKQRLTEFDRIAVLHEDLDDRSADLGRNLVEHLHRLNDADDCFRRNPRSDRHKRRVVRRCGGIKCAHRGTVNGDRAVGRWRCGWRLPKVSNRWLRVWSRLMDSFAADRVCARIHSPPQGPFLVAAPQADLGQAVRLHELDELDQLVEVERCVLRFVGVRHANDRQPQFRLARMRDWKSSLAGREP